MTKTKSTLVYTQPVLLVYIYIYIYIYISEHNQNAQNDGNRAQPLNSF